MAKWVSVCSCCGRAGSSITRADNQGKPHSNPYSIGGKCPSSSDGKHKPRWEKA